MTEMHIEKFKKLLINNNKRIRKSHNITSKKNKNIINLTRLMKCSSHTKLKI